MVPPPLLLLPLLLQRRLTLGVSDVRSIGSETGRFLDMLRYAAARLAAGEAARWLHAHLTKASAPRPVEKFLHALAITRQPLEPPENSILWPR